MPTLVTRGLLGRYLVTRGMVPNASPPATHADLLEALIAHLDGDANVTGVLTGSVWSDEAPVGTVFPYAVITEIAGDEEYSTADADDEVSYVDEPTFQIAVFGTKATCRSVGRAIDTSINDASLTFDSGTLLYLRRDGAPITQLDGSLGPGGVDVWQRITVYRAIIQRTL